MLELLELLGRLIGHVRVTVARVDRHWIDGVQHDAELKQLGRDGRSDSCERSLTRGVRDLAPAPAPAPAPTLSKTLGPREGRAAPSRECDGPADVAHGQRPISVCQRETKRRG